MAKANRVIQRSAGTRQRLPRAYKTGDEGLDVEFDTPEQEAAFQEDLQEIGRRFGLGPKPPTSNGDSGA